ncbi:MAG: lysophospholipid acyltransferase family protein [Gemmatimonadaceae bacterium]
MRAHSSSRWPGDLFALLRAPFVILGMAILTGVLAPVVVVAGLLRIQEKPKGIYQWCMHTWCRGILRIAGVKLVLHHAERMSDGDGHVYMANHVSWFDVFALAAVIPRYTWIAKAELKRIPLFSQAAQAAGIVFIDRDNRKAAFGSYETAAKDVQRGRSIIVCPEGTRGKDYHLRPFKKGPFVLAIASGVPVIPVILYGTREVMPKGSFVIRGGTVHIHFLDPVPTQGYSYDDRTRLMEEVWSRMADEMRRLYGVNTAEMPIATEGERKE